VLLPSLLPPAGTIVYMPKELLLSGRMTQATDIYSFGLMSEWLIGLA
jgi:serine/threonine protein kinase